MMLLDGTGDAADRDDDEHRRHGPGEHDPGQLAQPAAGAGPRRAEPANAKLAAAVAITMEVGAERSARRQHQPIATTPRSTVQDSVVLRLTPVPSEGNLPTVTPCAVSAAPAGSRAEDGFTMVDRADGADDQLAADRGGVRRREGRHQQHPARPRRQARVLRGTRRARHLPLPAQPQHRAVGELPAQGATQVPGGPTNLRYSYTPGAGQRRQRVQHRRTPCGTLIDFSDRLLPDEVHRHVRRRLRSPGRSSPASAATPRSTSSGTRSTRPSIRTPTRTRRASRTAPRSERDGRPSTAA